MHTTTPEDVDWYKFDAIAGETYLIQVSGYLDGYLYFYDTDGTTLLTDDDDNDEDVDVQISHWGNPVLLWNCSASGMYYFNVQGYGSSVVGYYSLELITTSDLEITKTNNEKSKKKKKRGFLR